MKKKIISTKKAPGAVGPYSQGVRVGKMVYTAGQIALDPDSGQMVEGDISVQTDRVLRNIEAVLKAAGTSLNNVVKTTVFLRDINDFAAMNEVYGGFFDEKPPARSTVPVPGLPLGALVEIEAVAVIKKKKSQ